MKKILKAAVVASIITAPAIAAQNNMENPLYLPKQNELYSKTSGAVMIKKADSSDAHVNKGHDGAIEFPIWRFNQDIGYGITDRLMVHGSFGYTHDGDISRKGMHQGRVGLTYRSFHFHEDFVWDWYGDFHLGGISKMKGAIVSDGTNSNFNYSNYSNGRWGFHAGTKLGKVWGRFTGAVFAEIQQTFGNSNNEIDITRTQFASIPGMPSAISVNLKSSTEFNAGIKTFYEINNRWSWGAGFTYKHHVPNGVVGLDTELPAGLPPILVGQVDALLASMEDMEDGFDEYAITLSVARKLSDRTQVALYGEYTFDTAQKQSQNGTDIKAEVGVRFNVSF